MPVCFKSCFRAFIPVASILRAFPNLILFDSSYGPYKEGVPGNWLFGYSNNGYMDGELFLQWFKKIFIPNCGSQRPVILVMDNHISHMSIDVINMAIENNIELLGLPPHTTHILQPLDVHINGPLKNTVSKTAVHLGYANKQLVINKSKFPAVLSYSIDKLCSPSTVKEAFRMTGIHPLNPDAIDKSQLVQSHNVSISQQPSTSNNSDEPVPSTSFNCTPHEPQSYSSSAKAAQSSICTTCGSFLGGNPLVTEGLIPQHLADIFLPVPCKPLAKKRKIVTESRVLTSAEFVQQITEKEEQEKKKKEELEKRKQERVEKRQKREAEKELKRKQKAKKRKSLNTTNTTSTNIYHCKICNLADPEDDENNDTTWICCEVCEDWIHTGCADLMSEDNLDELDYICPNCIVEE